MNLIVGSSRYNPGCDVLSTNVLQIVQPKFGVVLRPEATF